MRKSASSSTPCTASLRRPTFTRRPDPISKRTRHSYKFSHWLLQCYLNSWRSWTTGGTAYPLLLEDLPKYRDYLDTFARHETLLRTAAISVDILSYGGPHDLFDKRLPFWTKENNQLPNEKISILAARGDIIVLANRIDLFTAIPLTMEAAKVLGSGTEWCISAREDSDNAFDEHLDEGLFVIARLAGKGKFAFRLNLSMSQ